MDLSTQFLFFFSVVGIFNGILWSAYCLLFNHRRILSRFLFGGLLLTMCLRNSKSVMVYFGQTLEFPWLLVLGQSACMMIGPVLYGFVISNIRQSEKWNPQIIWPISCVSVVVLLGILFYPISSSYDFWRNDSRDIVHSVLSGFILLTGWELRSTFLKFRDLQPFEFWTLLIFVLNVIVGIGYITALVSGEYTVGPLVFSMLIYILLAFFIYNYNQVDRLFLKYMRSVKSIDDSIVQEVLSNLSDLMNDQKLYKQHDVRIQNVAEALSIPKHLLSQLLNDHLGVRFSRYINSYRIAAACEMLNGSTNYTLEGIGHEVGFRSKSTFFSTFKKMKSMTPLQYQKLKESE